jgi:hypothetical protein
LSLAILDCKNFNTVTDEALKFLLILCCYIKGAGKIDTTVRIYAGHIKIGKTFDIFKQLCGRSIVRIEYINSNYYSVFLTKKGIEYIDVWDVLSEI